MTESLKESKVSAWVLFIAIILLLIGIYGGVRTGVNLLFFPKYPTSGVLSMNFVGFPVYNQNEEDCAFPQTYFTADGKTSRPATPEEKEQEKINQQNCVRSAIQARESARINDISQSILFLFLGTGLIFSRRFFPKQA